MGMLDSVLGSVLDKGANSLVSNFIEKQGGISNLVSQFEQNGLGSLMQSWVGTGENESIAPEQIQQALGSDKITELASQFGASEGDVTAQMAKILPDVINQMTPEGSVSEAA